jgi:diguanylate cyclase (GGDEF)-like protein
VDHFKSVNDTYGHDVGDKVLQALARLTSEQLRRVDQVGRLGGEEFAVLFPEMHIAGARTACERLLSRVRGTKVGAGAHELSCTISAGLTECGEEHDTVNAILKRADVALYKAKNNGRDRVEAA